MLEQFFSERRIELLRISEGATVALRFADARAEHLATRAGAGLYDFSFMGLYEVNGRDSRAYLERLQTRCLAQLEPGKLYYTLLLREDGSVLSDATLWCLKPDHYWLFTGRRGDFEWLEQHQRNASVSLINRSGAYAILALQGPRCVTILEQVLGVPLRSLAYFAFTPGCIDGVPAWIGRLGYSGELGYEILVPAADGISVWQSLLTAGRLCACRNAASRLLTRCALKPGTSCSRANWRDRRTHRNWGSSA